MGWAKWAAVAVSLVEAAYMFADGVRALRVGDYWTPRTGDHAGELGPWAGFVRRVGIDPRGRAMKRTFVAYGAAWLAITVAFAAGLSWAWLAMLIAAAGSLWYLVPGTIMSALVIVLLLLPGVRP